MATDGVEAADGRTSGRARDRGHRARRVVTRVGLIALALGLAAVVGFVVWAQNPMRAEPDLLAAVRSDAALRYTDDGTTVVLRPRDADGTGLLFLAGARVDAPAYAATLRGIADAGITVVIARPTLNFAILETRGPAFFERSAPGIRRWFVGGHSLGGVIACRWATDPQAHDTRAAGLLLLGSYCADDLSSSGLPVLSIGGARDGLSTPEKIADARHLLPADARLVEIPGAAHAQFGAYGTQPGDGRPTASDSAVRAAITGAAVPFLVG